MGDSPFLHRVAQLLTRPGRAGARVLLVVLLGGTTAAGQQPGSTGRDDAGVIRSTLERGAYREAVGLAAENVAAASAAFGATSLEAAEASDLLVEAWTKDGHSAAAAEAMTRAEQVVRTKERLLGPSDARLAVSLQNLADVRTARGEYSLAVSSAQRAVTLRRAASPHDDVTLADSLETLALPLIYLERFVEAGRAIDESSRLRESGRPPPAALAHTLYLEALLHRNDGDYPKAKIAIDRVLSIRPAASGHPEAIQALELQGDLRFLDGDMEAAGSAWTSALDLARRTVGAEHPLVPRLLRVLAMLSQLFGDLDRARALLDQGRQIAERVLAPCDREPPTLLNDLGNLSKFRGDFEESRRFFRSALTKAESCLGASHSMTATIIYNSATLAMNMGDLAEAERLQRRAVDAWTRSLGPDHPYVARGLEGLAEVAGARGRRDEARLLLERVLAQRRRTLGSDHPDVAATLITLARLEADAGRMGVARRQVEDAIGIYDRGGRPQEPDYRGSALVLRGRLEALQGDYQEARRTFAEAAALREQIFGADHPLTAEAVAGVAAADFSTGDFAGALAGAVAAERVGRDHLRFTIRYLTERQALDYASKRPRGLDLALSIVAAGRVDDAASVSALDSVIRSRAVILDELAARSRTVARGTSALAALETATATARARYANLMLRSLEGSDAVSQVRLEEARRQREAAERDLAEQSGDARLELARADIGFQDVSRALPPGDGLVSFVLYDRTSFATAGGRTVAETTPSYIALVVRPGTSHVIAVPLGPAVSLDATVIAWRGLIEDPSVDLPGGATDAELRYRRAGERLRQRIWDPLADLLRGANHVFVVPDGTLNLVSFAALPVDGQRYLIETAPVMHLLSTERDLVSAQTPDRGRGLLAVGGPTYDVPSPRDALGMALRSGCGSVGALRFADLPSARAEALDIARIWSATMGLGNERASSAELTVLSGPAAAKGAVLRALSGRRVVHLATHGFFLGSPCANTPAATRGVGGLVSNTAPASLLEENPLLLSGLALAGANRQVTTGGRTPEDTGILTAEEVAGLNLQGTEWAVLSACDTGVGQVRAGEGVFGLRRAFQIAGVRTVIMSLWSVQDEATRVWMRTLYRNRFEQGMNTADALHSATLQMLRDRRSRGASTHPFFWAAFVAVGDWQ